MCHVYACSDVLLVDFDINSCSLCTVSLIRLWLCKENESICNHFLGPLCKKSMEAASGVSKTAT